MTVPDISERIRRFRAPAYFILGLAVVIPLTEFFLSVSPWRFGNVMWRFGTMGLAAAAMGTPLTGMLFVCLLALIVGDRNVVRVIAVVAGVISVILLAGAGSFVLDALQMRARIRPEGARQFKFASGQALVKLLLEGVASGVLAIYAYRSVRGARAEKVRVARESLVVGRATSAEPPSPSGGGQRSVPAL